MIKPKSVILFLLLILSAHYMTAQSNISIDIKSPVHNQLSDDSLFVSVSISSTYEIMSVKASVEERITDLKSLSGNFQGYLILGGLSRGTKTLTVTAIDYLGNTEVTTRDFRYDKKPILTVHLPASKYNLAEPIKD